MPKKGYKQTDIHKKHMSKSAIGNTHGFQKGKPSIFRGKIRDNIRGKNHWNWKNGSSSESKIFKAKIEYRLWREAIFARDNWTCQKYGIKGEYLHPHHIKNFSQYPELRLALDNGITLSEKAHREFHKKYGKKNNTREQLEEFLK